MRNSDTKLEKVAFWVNVSAFILAVGIPLIFAIWVQELGIALLGIIGFAALINIRLMKSDSKWAREFLLGAPVLVASVIASNSYDNGLSSALIGFIFSYLLLFFPGLLAFLAYRKKDVPKLAFYKSPTLALASVLLASVIGSDLVYEKYQNYLENKPPVYQKVDNGNDEFERWIPFAGGFFDPNLKDYIIPPQFEEVRAFSEDGLAAVRLEGKWGYINSEAELVIKPRFSNAGPFIDKKAIVSLGEITMRQIGSALVLNSNQETLLINNDGEVIKKNKLIVRDGDCWVYECSLIPVSKEPELEVPYGYMDRELQITIPLTFKHAGKFFSNGIAKVKDANDEFRYINKNGEFVGNIGYYGHQKVEKKDKKAARKNGYKTYEGGVVTYFDRKGNQLVYAEKACDQSVIRNAKHQVIWPKGFDESCNNESASSSLKYDSSSSANIVDSGPVYTESRNEKRPFEIALQKISNKAPREPLLIDSSTKRDYISKGGIVIDRDNNLMWSRCAHGQSWNGKTCSEEPLEVTGEQAGEIAKSNTLGGFHDWRLPTIKELQTLIYCSNGKRIQYDGKQDAHDEGIGCIVENSRTLKDVPTVDISHFIDHAGNVFWSSTTVKPSVYVVLFDESKIIALRGTTMVSGTNGMKSSHYVRLVRSGGSFSTGR